MADPAELFKVFKFAMMQIKRYHWKKEVLLFKHTAVLVGSPPRDLMIPDNDDHPLWT